MTLCITLMYFITMQIESRIRISFFLATMVRSNERGKSQKKKVQKEVLIH